MNVCYELSRYEWSRHLAESRTCTFIACLSPLWIVPLWTVACYELSPLWIGTAMNCPCYECLVWIVPLWTVSLWIVPLWMVASPCRIYDLHIRSMLVAAMNCPAMNCRLLRIVATMNWDRYELSLLWIGPLWIVAAMKCLLWNVCYELSRYELSRYEWSRHLAYTEVINCSSNSGSSDSHLRDYGLLVTNKFSICNK